MTGHAFIINFSKYAIMIRQRKIDKALRHLGCDVNLDYEGNSRGYLQS